MAATYTNKALKESYTLNGVNDLEQAHNMATFVCYRNNWNLSMFNYDVKVSLK